jgi:hypothetical protein
LRQHLNGFVKMSHGLAHFAPYHVGNFKIEWVPQDITDSQIFKTINEGQKFPRVCVQAAPMPE